MAKTRNKFHCACEWRTFCRGDINHVWLSNLGLARWTENNTFFPSRVSPFILHTRVKIGALYYGTSLRFLHYNQNAPSSQSSSTIENSRHTVGCPRCTSKPMDLFNTHCGKSILEKELKCSTIQPKWFGQFVRFPLISTLKQNAYNSDESSNVGPHDYVGSFPTPLFIDQKTCSITNHCNSNIIVIKTTPCPIT